MEQNKDNALLMEGINNLVSSFSQEQHDKFQEPVKEFLSKNNIPTGKDIRFISEYLSSLLALDDYGYRVELYKEAIPECAGNDKLLNACIAWGSVYRQVGSLVENLRKSSLCCMDVGRWVANSYIAYAMTGNLPDLHRTDDTYWLPWIGTAEEWMDIADAIVRQTLFNDGMSYVMAVCRLIQNNIGRKVGAAAK